MNIKPVRRQDRRKRREEPAMPRITPFLWFDTEAEEAAEFYCSIFPNSKITAVSHYTDAGPRPAGTVMTVSFVLDGHEFTALNGGPEYKFTEAISLLINCADQAEVDHYWDQLTAGGEEVACGWLKDRYGLSWQVAPKKMVEWFGDPDEKSERVMTALLGMRKLDIAALERAYEGG
jgi:predicted 3-demethylubiquinone-9 3-methyltransferase (glyoxalase superfamily)